MTQGSLKEVVKMTVSIHHFLQLRTPTSIGVTDQSESVSPESRKKNNERNLNSTQSLGVLFLHQLEKKKSETETDPIPKNE